MVEADVTKNGNGAEEHVAEVVPGSVSNPNNEAASADASSEGAETAEQTRAEVAKLKELWMRTAADFDNYRKRSRREVEDAARSAREDFLRQLLPVFDNLERAIQSSQRAGDVKAVADGLSMVLKQFLDTLARVGIQKVSTVGSPFDPSVHEAIQQVETAEHAPGTVIAEVQAGYIQGERLVRAAMVVVAKAVAPPPPSGDGPASTPAA